MNRIGYWLGNVSLNSGGISPYSWRILECLLSDNKLQEIELILLCSVEAEIDCLHLIKKYQAKAQLVLIPQKFSLVNRFLSRCADTTSKGLVKLNLPSERFKYLNSWFRWFLPLKLDLLHIPSQTPPSYELPCPFIVTMHDVQELHYPEFFSPQDRAWRAKYYWKALEKSLSVIVSFNHVKQDIIKYFNLPENKIFVCPLPFQNISLQLPSQGEEHIYKNKYDPWGKFLLYPAQTWQHKNHLSLIKALGVIKKKFGRVIHLVCTGKRNDKYFPILKEKIEQSNMSAQVHFMDIVPESELYWLYKNCALTIIPTLYEAGSFPLIEAMFLKTPVICSSVTSLPDTIGDPQFTFDPLDVEQITNLIINLLDDSGMREDNINNSIQKIQKMKDINSGLYLHELYAQLLA